VLCVKDILLFWSLCSEWQHIVICFADEVAPILGGVLGGLIGHMIGENYFRKLLILEIKNFTPYGFVIFKLHTLVLHLVQTDFRPISFLELLKWIQDWYLHLQERWLPTYYFKISYLQIQSIFSSFKARLCPWRLWGQQLKIELPHITVRHHLWHFTWLKFHPISST